MLQVLVDMGICIHVRFFVRDTFRNLDGGELMIKACMFCGRVKGVGDGDDWQFATHGICHDCKDKGYEEAHREYKQHLRSRLAAMEGVNAEQD
jgi:hypothetical protein